MNTEYEHEIQIESKRNFYFVSKFYECFIIICSHILSSKEFRKQTRNASRFPSHMSAKFFKYILTLVAIKENNIQHVDCQIQRILSQQSGIYIFHSGSQRVIHVHSSIQTANDNHSEYM